MLKNLSLPIRLGLLLAVLAGMYFTFLAFDSGSKAAPGAVAGAPAASQVAGPAAAPPAAEPAAEPLAPRASFSYLPPAPVGGKVRGVIELGASGFNSFIVTTDADHRWQLNKAEYDNSLLLENMASDEEIRRGLRAYIANMLDYGVAGRDIHFVVSSGALKAPATPRITQELAHIGYVVNKMTSEKEAAFGMSVAMPPSFADKAFVVDMGSGGTEISWLAAGEPQSANTYGSKYFEAGTASETVASDVRTKAAQVPAALRQTCFIIGGVPYEMAKQVRHGKERYTVLDAASAYRFDKAKTRAGLVIYRALADATGCQQFVFDWDANFTIGYLLALPQ